MVGYFKKALLCLIGLILLQGAYALEEASAAENLVAEEIRILKEAYPEVRFDYRYDSDKSDWEIQISADGRRSLIYRAEGRYLNESQLANREGYRFLLYNFPESLMDPADFSAEQIDRITNFGSTENRRNGRVSSSAFFDAIYDSDTRADVESHIADFTFFGQTVRVHEKITPALENVERKIRSLAAEDDEIHRFVRNLGSISGYAWRQVRDTSGKSFHSMGLAVDILPANAQGRAIYWNWEKNKGNDLWMLIPLAERWAPPEEVIRIFESEGFAWGGMWPIWDNMHFEYRPELLLWRDR